MPKSVKGGPFEIFNIHWDFEKKQKMGNFNSLIVPKNLKKRTHWNFLTFVLLQKIKQIEGRTPWGHLKIFEN